LALLQSAIVPKFLMSFRVCAKEIATKKSFYRIADFSFLQSRVFEISQRALTREHRAHWFT